MEIMIREYLTAILRNVATPLIAYLAASGYISENEATNLVVAVIAIVVSLVWSLANKYLWKQTAKEALQHPPTSSDVVLKDIIAGK